VRRQQSISVKVLAKRLATTAEEIREQQSPASDLLLSQLYKWQAALHVPAADLLLEPENVLSPSVDRRARLVKLMKTVRSLQKAANSKRLRMLAERLADELIEVMPELVGIDSWPIVGKRRSPSEASPREERPLRDPFSEWTRLSSEGE
jgi:hypothetical protein